MRPGGLEYRSQDPKRQDASLTGRESTDIFVAYFLTLYKAKVYSLRRAHTSGCSVGTGTGEILGLHAAVASSAGGRCVGVGTTHSGRLSGPRRRGGQPCVTRLGPLASLVLCHSKGEQEHTVRSAPGHEGHGDPKSDEPPEPGFHHQLLRDLRWWARSVPGRTQRHTSSEDDSKAISTQTWRKEEKPGRIQKFVWTS